jgi:membrane associated rhomboid family serine protease
MLFVPYSTDAPIYYWPLSTVGLIVANVAAFLAVAVGGVGTPENWILSFGDGLHPDQWLLSIFMHAGPGHLIGNMIFLWLFGLVVEGKLGWWRMLCCYLAIGIGQAMIEQLVMLGYTGDVPGAVGASGAIFGLMAMAMIWAPKNEITYFYWVAFYVGTFDISIAMMAGLYTGWEVLMVCIFGSEAGSSWLHLTGFVLGLPLATVLLKRGIVDCEGWDAFSVWSGNYGGFREEPDHKDELRKLNAEQKRKVEQLASGAQQQFRQYLQNGNADAAIRLYEKMKHVRDAVIPARSDWLTMIQWYHSQKRWADSAPYMANYIDDFPQQADAVRIKLAQICVVELQRPGKALDLLAEVDADKLPEKQATLVKRIQAKALQMQEEGVVELDLDTW